MQPAQQTAQQTMRQTARAELGGLSTRLIGPPGGDLSHLMNLCAYATVAVGYLYSVLAASRLTLLAFLVFTALNLLWLGAFWLLNSERTAAWEPRILAALVVLALGAQMTAWLGIGLDWLLPVVAASILALGLPWRPALASTVAIFLSTFATVALGTTGAADSVGAFFQLGVTSALQLLPVYLFVVIFSLVMRRQQQLRERAEQLAAELARSKLDLEQANAQLRRFAQQVEELAVTQERNRLAREIHDTLGHYLTILAVKLETATRLEALGEAEARGAGRDPRLRAELAEARRMASECLSEVRHSVAALRPAAPTATTLEESLRHLAGEFESAAPGATLTLDLGDHPADLPPDVRVALYRCAQEALTNVRKHAHASKVLLRLRADPTAAELTVLDNGAGDTRQEDHEGEQVPEQAAPGFGLIGMRERVALLGGAVAAGPDARGGWRVEARVPLGAAGSTSSSGTSATETDTPTLAVEA